MKNKPLFLRIYFLIATTVWLFGMIIGLGSAVYQTASQFIITDQEYILSQRSRDLDQCSQPIPTKVDWSTVKQPTQAEIDTCKAEKTENISLTRKAQYKYDLLAWLVRGILFAILFATHYPKFMASNKEE